MNVGVSVKNLIIGVFVKMIISGILERVFMNVTEHLKLMNISI